MPEKYVDLLDTIMFMWISSMSKTQTYTAVLKIDIYTKKKEKKNLKRYWNAMIVNETLLLYTVKNLL